MDIAGLFEECLEMDPAERRRLRELLESLMGLNRQCVIGFLDDHTIRAEQTREQVVALTSLQCDLIHEDGSPVVWSDLWNPEVEPSRGAPLLNYIIGDREWRVDRKIVLCDRPPTAVVTVHDDACVRFEYYAGHDALELLLDLRSAELTGQDLDPFMAEDPHAWDRMAYLRSVRPELSDPKASARVARMLDFHHQITDTYRMPLEEHERLSIRLVQAAMRHGARINRGVALEVVEPELIGEYRQILADRYIAVHGSDAE